MGLPWTADKTRTYHARGQEHRHIVAVLQAHLQEEEVTWQGTGHGGF